MRKQSHLGNKVLDRNALCLGIQIPAMFRWEKLKMKSHFTECNGGELDCGKQKRRSEILLMNYGLQIKICDTPIYVWSYTCRVPLELYPSSCGFVTKKVFLRFLLSFPIPKAGPTSRNGVCRRLWLYRIWLPHYFVRASRKIFKSHLVFHHQTYWFVTDRTTFSFCVRHL